MTERLVLLADTLIGNGALLLRFGGPGHLKLVRRAADRGDQKGGIDRLPRRTMIIRWLRDALPRRECGVCTVSGGDPPTEADAPRPCCPRLRAFDHRRLQRSRSSAHPL